MSNKSSGGGRLLQLDALRGIAALGVVLYHFVDGYVSVAVGGAGPPHRGAPALSMVYGSHGVALFFVISGFVISMTLERARDALDYAVSRLARLVPALLACGAITALLVFAIGFNPQHVGRMDAIASLTFMPGAFGRTGLDPSYWTLGFEVIFYALIAFFHFGLKGARLEWLCLAWLAAGVAALPWQGQMPEALRILLNPEYSYLFVFGVVAYLAHRRRTTMLTWATASAAAVAALLHPLGGPGALLPLTTLVVSAALTLIVYLAAERRLGVLEARPLLLLGEVSYSLYLVHQTLGYWIIMHLERAGAETHVAILVTAAAMVGLATLIRFSVEAPGQRLMRGAFRRFTGRRTHATAVSALTGEVITDRTLAAGIGGRVVQTG